MRLFAFIGSLLVLLLAAAFIVPPYVDWNRFKTRFEAEASLVLGQRVEVRGTTTARLLPLPSVTFTDLRIGPVGAPLLSADAFAMDVELAPLLRGDVTIVDMRLDRPRAQLALDRQGGLAWPGGAPSGGAGVAVENLSIVDGSLRLSDPATGRDIVISDVDATADAASLEGPWRMDGTLVQGGERYLVRAGTGRWQAEDNQLRLRADVQPRTRPYDFTFDGPLALKDGRAQLSGLLAVVPAREPADEDRIRFPRTFESTASPIRLEADVTLDAAALAVPAWKLEVGETDDPYVVSGSGSVTLGEVPLFDVVAEGQQIDGDRLLPGTEGPEAGPAGGATLADRVKLLSSALAALPDPGIGGSVALTLPAFVSGDTVVRDVALRASPAPAPLEGARSWRLSNATATLPGRTTVQADGVLTLENAAQGQLAYAGALTVASQQPSGLAAWLGASDDEGVRNLQIAGFTATARLGPGLIKLDDMEVQVDGDNLTGRFEARDGGAYDVALKGERVDLDRLKALTHMLTISDGAGLGNGDGALALEADVAVLDGVSARQVSGRLLRTGGDIRFEAVTIGELAGLAIEAGDSGDTGAGVTVALRGADGTAAAALLSSRLGGVAVLDRLARTAGALDGPDLKFTVSDQSEVVASGTLGGTNVNAQFSLDRPLSALLTGGTDALRVARVVLDNPDAAALLRQLGLPVPDEATGGRAAFRMSGRAGDADAVAVEGALTVAGGSFMDWSGSLVPQIADGTLSASGTLDVRGEVRDLRLLQGLSGRALPAAALGQDAIGLAKVTLDGGTTRLSDLVFEVAGVPVTGDLTVDTEATPRPSVAGRMSVQRLDAALVRELGVGEGRLIDGVDLDLSLAVEEARLGGSAMREISGSFNATGGDARVQIDAGRWLGGSATGSVTLARAGDTVLTAVKGNLTGAALADVSAATGLPEGPTGSADISASLETSARGAADVLARLSGSGTVTLVDASVPLLAPGMFKSLMAAADSTDDDKLIAAAPGLALAAAAPVATRIEATGFAFTVNEGVARADNVPFDAEGLTGAAAGRLDLRERTYEVRAEITLDAEPEVVAGATPQLAVSIDGPLGGEPRRIVRTEQLETYLAVRLAERRERDFLAQRATILERQRLRRTAQVYAMKARAKTLAREAMERAERERLDRETRAREAAERRRIEALEAARLEAEAKRAAEQEAKRQRALAAGEEGLRQRSREALERLDEPTLNFDAPILPGG